MLAVAIGECDELFTAVRADADEHEQAQLVLGEVLGGPAA
jgi:hypothetical protein